MAQPTLSDVHVNALLTNLSNMYAQEESNFIASRVFPIVPVQKASDRYLTYSRADFNRNTMRKRAPSTESAGGGYTIDNTPTYSVNVWALHKDIDDQVRANADAILSLDMEATKWLTTQYLISKEVDWSAAFFTNVWTSLLTGVAAAPGANQALQWNDPNSTPIVDIRKFKQLIQLTNGGFRPNKAVIGRQVFDTLMDHPDFIYRLNAGQTPGGPAVVNKTRLAEVFELDEVLVMDAIQNTAAEDPAATVTPMADLPSSDASSARVISASSQVAPPRTRNPSTGSPKTDSSTPRFSCSPPAE